MGLRLALLRARRGRRRRSRHGLGALLPHAVLERAAGQDDAPRATGLRAGGHPPRHARRRSRPPRGSGGHCPARGTRGVTLRKAEVKRHKAEKPKEGAGVVIIPGPVLALGLSLVVLLLPFAFCLLNFSCAFCLLPCAFCL